MNRPLITILSLFISTLTVFPWSTGYVIQGWYKEKVETFNVGTTETLITMDWDRMYEKIIRTSIAGGTKNVIEEYYWSERINPSSFRTKWRMARAYGNDPSFGATITLGGDTPMRTSGMAPRIGSWAENGTNLAGQAYLRTVSGDFTLIMRRGPFWDVPDVGDSFAHVYARTMNTNRQWNYFCAGYRVGSGYEVLIHPQRGDFWPCLGTPQTSGDAGTFASGGILWVTASYYGWWSVYPGDESLAIIKTGSDAQVPITPIPTHYWTLSGMTKEGPTMVINSQILEMLIEPWTTIPPEPGFPGDPMIPDLP